MTREPATATLDRARGARLPASRLRRAWLVVRSALLWAASGLYFAVVCSFVVVLAIFFDPRRNDRPQRILCRHILRLIGVGFEVRYAPGFDRSRTSLFVANHVNIFDPFVVYSAVPQFVRGLELESHFRIPIYGWLMKRFGNIPVSASATASEMKKLFKRTRAALDSGISLVVFPEGSRTRTGRVGPFKKGVFSMARHFGYPIVPMSIAGSFEAHRTGDWMLYPSKIVVHIHDTIETAGLTKHEEDALAERVHSIVAAPIHEDAG